MTGRTETTETMTLAEAYRIARARAWAWGGEDCTAAWAWEHVSKRRRTAVTKAGCYYEALMDLDAAGDPDETARERLAVQTIARADLARLRTWEDTPRTRRLITGLIEAADLTDEVAA